MTGLFQPARKEALRARVALCGPTGSGKTWTALAWAEVLAGSAGRIAVIDTENRSASLYADRYSFDVATFDPPYDPGRLTDIVRQAAASYDVVIVDSLSHFWDGEGGTLDIADSAGRRSGGNSFAGWKIATPALRHLIDTLRSVDAHVLVTMRSKMEYVLERDERTGKTTPTKVGMAPVMRDGVLYEFTVVGELDLEHRLVVTKSRCSELADQVAQPGRAHELAATFRDWLSSGVRLASRAQLDAIVGPLEAIADPEERKAAKAAFVGRWGLPDRITADDADEAAGWVTGLRNEEAAS